MRPTIPYVSAHMRTSLPNTVKYLWKVSGIEIRAYVSAPLICGHVCTALLPEQPCVVRLLWRKKPSCNALFYVIVTLSKYQVRGSYI